MTHEVPLGFETQPHQERMSNEELGNFLAAVGNGEHKALLLIAMSLPPNALFTGYDMKQAIAHVQGLPANAKPKTGWIESPTALVNHCATSFSQIGLVSQELKDPTNNVLGYKVTDKGLHEGVALAGLLLDYSERHDIPLREIFSDTSSHGKEREAEGEFQFKNRAPLNRVKILRTLLELPQPIRVADVTYQMIGINRKDIGEHCNDLCENGLIDVEHIAREGPTVEYRASSFGGEIVPHPKFKKLTGEVIALLRQNPNAMWTASSVVDQLVKENPEKASQTALLESVRKVLGTLRREGAVESPNFSREEQSRILLSDGQRSLITELLQILSEFQNRSPELLEQGRRLALDFVNSPQKALSAMQRAKEASSHAEPVSVAEVEKAIIAIIDTSPGTTVDGIRDNLKLRGYRLKASTIRNHLGRMRSKGSIVSEGKRGNVMHWRIAS